MKTVKEHIDHIEIFLSEADKLIHDSSFKTSIKLKTSAILFNIVIDHASACVLLLKAEKYSSVSALLRVIYENLVRALWIKNCATEVEVSLFLEKDKVLKNPNKEYHSSELVEAVDKVVDAENIFSVLHKKFWKIYCSFTHGGIEQINRNINKECIQLNYNDEEIILFSQFILCFSMFSLIQISEITGKEKEVDELISRFLPAEGLTFI